MENRWWDGSPTEGRGWIQRDLEALARPSILLVEDDPDIRELLVTLLDIAGFSTEACATAEAGLEQLREQPFDLVLTDYMLPHRSGAWLLREASEEGLLDATPVLVVTAHPNPRDTEGYEIVQKPFDLDALVERVRQRLSGTSKTKTARGVRANAQRSRNGSDDDCPAPIELILYVSGQSPRSATAIANVRKVISQFESSKVKLTIHDLSKDPSPGHADNVAFTPTLVKRSPGPRTFILGHMTNPSLLLELLEGCQES